MNRNNFDIIYGELLANAKHNFELINNQKLIFLISKLLNLIRMQVCNLFFHKPTLTDKNILLCLTDNQARSTISLRNENNLVVRPFLDSARIAGVDVMILPSFRFFLNAFRQYKWFKDSGKLSLRARIYLSIAYFYYYDGFFYVFKKEKPKSVTITNASHPILRCAIEAAKELGVKTVYLPHAHPSRLYPRIDTDFALLEGRDGLEYYTFNEKCKKILVGAIRLDPYKRLKPVPHDRLNILVATNLLDDMKEVKSLLKKINDTPPPIDYNIILRPHPNQTVERNEYSDIKYLLFSDSRKESCFEVLTRSDILIAGNTTTFFEAIYLPIICFYYDFIKEGNIKDSYELMSYGFIRQLKNISQLYEEKSMDKTKDLERVDYSYGRIDSSLVEIEKFYSEI